jgi:predicted phosphodiesterase
VQEALAFGWGLLNFRIMNIDDIKGLISSGKSDREIGRIIVDAGIIGSITSARKGVGLLRKMMGKTVGYNHSISEDFDKGQTEEVFTVDNPPTSLEDALRGSKVDLSVWDVQKWVWNHWAGRYQVKVWFAQKEHDPQEKLSAFLNSIKDGFNKSKSSKVAGRGTAVVALADFHLGMKWEGDAKNPPFDAEILAQRIAALVDKINAQGFEEVHLALLGDFIESFTGLNHLDTWKHLESYGRTAVMGVCGLIRDELILRLNNVSNVYIVAGNHDRVTNKKDQDARGEAAGLIADVLELMIDTPIHFDYSYLNPKIDGTKYILKHGHLGMSKRSEERLLLEYGDPSCYNVILQGHDHKREVKKGHTIRKDYVTSTTSLEGSNFRKIIVPPLVSGGSFSSSLGLFGTTGATVVSSTAGGVDHWDLG